MAYGKESSLVKLIISLAEILMALKRAVRQLILIAGTARQDEFPILHLIEKRSQLSRESLTSTITVLFGGNT